MLARPSAFDTIFQGNTPFILSSSIAVKNKNGNVVIPTANIERIETTLRNSFLCSMYPTEETTISVLDWDKLPYGTKNYLSTKGSTLYIYYCVNNVWTTGARFCVVNECQVSFNQDRATIKCIGWFNRELLSNRTNPVGTYSRIAGSGEYYVSSFLAFACTQDLLSILNTIDGKQVQYYTANNYKVQGVFTRITIAEGLQNASLGCGGAPRLNYDDSVGFFYANIYDINHYEIAEMSLTNIYDDIEITHSTTPKEASVHGFLLDEEKQVYHTGFFRTTDPFDVGGGFDLDYIPSRCYVVMSQTIYHPTTTYYLAGSYYGRFTGNTGGGDFYIYAQQILPPSFEQEADKVVVASYVLPDTLTTQKDIVKANAEKYLSMEEDISFSCRVNPALEPLDYVYIPHQRIGNVLIEEITIIYDGGYSGTIKGKRLGILPPELTNLDTENYSFTIKNNNGKTAHLTIISSDGTYELEFDIPSGQSLTTSAQDYPAELWSSFYDYQHGSLTDDVYCWFTIDDFYSDNTIILEAQV